MIVKETDGIMLIHDIIYTFRENTMLDKSAYRFNVEVYDTEN